MVQTFSKPHAARQIEARGRAKQRGVRINVIEAQQAYSTLSPSQSAVVYTISRTRQGWTCDCDGFHYTGICKHVAAVERRSEREGWVFGKIAAVQTFKVDPALGLAASMAPRRTA